LILKFAVSGGGDTGAYVIVEKALGMSGKLRTRVAAANRPAVLCHNPNNRYNSLQ